MSGKYSDETLNKACSAISLGHIEGSRDIVTAVFDSLERAPWWEEVGEGYEFAPSEPWRSERQEDVIENRAGTGFTVEEGPRYGWTYFRDTRWTPPTPPPAPLAVGDVITTVEDLERLPVRAGVVDLDEDLAQKQDDDLWHYAITELSPRSDHTLLRCASSLTVAYLPSGDSE